MSIVLVLFSMTIMTTFSYSYNMVGFSKCMHMYYNYVIVDKLHVLKDKLLVIGIQ